MKAHCIDWDIADHLWRQGDVLSMGCTVREISVFATTAVYLNFFWLTIRKLAFCVVLNLWTLYSVHESISRVILRGFINSSVAIPRVKKSHANYFSSIHFEFLKLLRGLCTLHFAKIDKNVNFPFIFA